MKKKVYKSNTNRAVAAVVLSSVAVAVAARHGVDLNAAAAAVGLTLPEAMAVLTTALGSAIVFLRQTVAYAPKDEQDAITPRPK